MNTLWQDIRYAVRMMGKNLSVTAIVVVVPRTRLVFAWPSERNGETFSEWCSDGAWCSS